MTRGEFLRKKAKKITRQREALGLTRREVAEAIGVSEGAVLWWERGLRMMSAYNATTLQFYFKRKWAERMQQAAASTEATS